MKRTKEHQSFGPCVHLPLPASASDPRPRRHDTTRTPSPNSDPVWLPSLPATQLRFLIYGAIVLAATLGCGTPAALAQQPPSSGGSEFVDGMVRSLMESQMPRPSTRSAAPFSRPGVTVSDQVIRDARANLAGFAQELSQLVRILYQDADRTPGLRSLIGESLQLSAQATMLAQESARENTLDWFALEFQRVDTDWRQLSFRLRELRHLSDQAQRFLGRTDAYHARLTEMLQVGPQFDRSELIRQATVLATDLYHLLEEIDIGVTDARARYELLVDGRRVYQQSRRLAVDSEQARTLEEIHGMYREFQTLWDPFVTRLRPLQLRYIDREVQRVQEADRMLRNLLMLPAEMDRSELIHMTELLQRELDRLMDGVTLRNLAALTTGRDQIVSFASDFYSACGDFSECVRNGESAETMAELYQYLDGNWQRVAGVLQQADPPEARQVYRQLDRAIEDIRKQLSVQPVVDRERLGWLAAELDNRAGNLERDIRTTISARPNVFPATFRTQATTAAQQFRATARQLNRDIVTGQSINVVRERTNQLAQQWTALLAYIDRFPATDRDQLYATRQQIAPVIVDLQASLIR